MTSHPIFCVVANLNLAYQTNNRLLTGVLSYVKTHTVWSLVIVSGRHDEQKKFDPRAVHGLILQRKLPHWLRLSDLRRIPAAILEPNLPPEAPCCRIWCDNEPVAALAARHLLSKHCRAYAFVHSAGQKWSEERGTLFAEAVRTAGGDFLWRASERKALAHLIAEAPKPLGVFAATDILARTTLDACRLANCRVPDDVLILGMDNDVTLCEMSNPSLSSIKLDMYDVGYRAAEALDRAMRGEIAIDGMPDIRYTGDTVVERVSTTRPFAYDMLVQRVKEILATEFAAPIRIQNLAARFNVSRRTLETHFRTVTGTSIMEEVTRLRIEHAKRLLATTGDSQERIAEACGFYNATHLAATFRRHVGIRPSAFREKQTRQVAAHRNAAPNARS